MVALETLERKARQRAYIKAAAIVGAVAIIAVAVAFSTSSSQIGGNSNQGGGPNVMMLNDYLNDATAELGLRGRQAFVDGMRIVELEILNHTTSKFLYFWHPNGTDVSDLPETEKILRSQQQEHQETTQPQKLIGSGEELRVHEVHPHIIVDRSGSMEAYGFSGTVLKATHEGLLFLQELGLTRREVNQGKNPIPFANVHYFSDRSIDKVYTLASPVEEKGNRKEEAGVKTSLSYSQILADGELTGNTAPEKAFDSILNHVNQTLRQKISKDEQSKQIISFPIVMLTDGEFNGLRDYPTYWQKVATSFSDFSNQFENRVSFSLHVIGLRDDSLSQVHDMQRAFQSSSVVAFNYVTAKGIEEVSKAFAYAVDRAIDSASSTKVPLKDTTTGKLIWLREGEVKAVAAAPLQVNASTFSPWSYETLLYPLHFPPSLSLLQRKKVLALAAEALADLLLDISTFQSIIQRVMKSHENEASVAITQSEMKPLRERIDTALQRHEHRVEQLLPFLPIRVITCREAQIPCVTSPEELVEDSSPLLRWLRRGLTELAGLQRMVTLVSESNEAKTQLEYMASYSEPEIASSTYNKTMEVIEETLTTIVKEKVGLGQQATLTKKSLQRERRTAEHNAFSNSWRAPTYKDDDNDL